MMAVDSSVMIVIQLMTAPDMMPLVIIGTVTVKNALSLEQPREMAASSMDSGICWRIATEERMV